MLVSIFAYPDVLPKTSPQANSSSVSRLLHFGVVLDGGY